MTHAFLRADSVDVTQRCTKRAYGSMKEARRALGRGIGSRNHGLVATGTGRINAYRCPICGQYHLGHKL
jgi:hypothetical protein